MATIEQLLGQTTKHLADMSDDELAVYLKDVTNLEPKPLPKVLGSDKEDTTVEVDNCPIKLRKPKAAKATKPKLTIEQMKGAFDD